MSDEAREIEIFALEVNYKDGTSDNLKVDSMFIDADMGMLVIGIESSDTDEEMVFVPVEAIKSVRSYGKAVTTKKEKGSGKKVIPFH